MVEKGDGTTHALELLQKQDLVSHLTDSPVVVCLIPGMVIAMGITGNVHAWPLGIAALGDFFFYFLFKWLIVAMWVKWRAKSR